jgi:hypothetical protein
MVTIISIFDRHEDFIKLQYNSIKKYVRGNYEYIVFNNASTNDQSKRNEVVCEELGIKNIKISVNYNTQPSYIAGNALNESFKYLNKKYVFKIDSDMFFINDFNVDELFNHDLFYIPTYQPDKVLMWSGVFGINTQKIDLNLDFRPHVIHGTDTFGQSSLLTNDDKYTKKHFNLFMIYDVVGNVISGGLNNDCVVEFDGDDIVKWDKPNNYPIDKINKSNRVIYRYKEMYNILKKYEFPKPYYLDFIEINNIKTLIHFKSSNWCEWCTKSYVDSKKRSLINFLNDN